VTQLSDTWQVWLGSCVKARRVEWWLFPTSAYVPTAKACHVSRDWVFKNLENSLRNKCLFSCSCLVHG